jgi:hypothetical protein
MERMSLDQPKNTSCTYGIILSLFSYAKITEQLKNMIYNGQFAATWARSYPKDSLNITSVVFLVYHVWANELMQI